VVDREVLGAVLNNLEDGGAELLDFCGAQEGNRNVSMF